jgi:hypothetical protein
MKLFKYGIILERLKEADIELVRQWRNSDPVRLNMEYREIIGPDQQLEWYRSVNNLENNYMLVYYQGEKIGLLNDKNIDWEARTSESGLFLGETRYHATFVPLLISIAGIESNFFFLNWQKQYAHILRDNRKAVSLNTSLGYTLCTGQDFAENQLYVLTPEAFEATAGKIRKAVRALAGDDSQPRLLLEPEDYSSGFARMVESCLNQTGSHLVRKETTEGVWFTVRKN